MRKLQPANLLDLYPTLIKSNQCSDASFTYTVELRSSTIKTRSSVRSRSFRSKLFQHRLFIIRTSSENGFSSFLPLKTTFRTKVTHYAAQWPPDNYHKFECFEGQLSFQFHDNWNPWEYPLLNSDRESVWKATFMQEARRWRLDRVRFLDYESGADSPFPEDWPE